MNFLLKLFKITCKDTNPIFSNNLDGPIPFSKRLRMNIHLAICGVCRYYKRQLEALSALASKLGEEDSPAISDITLPQESKERIKKAIEKASSN